MGYFLELYNSLIEIARHFSTNRESGISLVHYAESGEINVTDGPTGPPTDMHS